MKKSTNNSTRKKGNPATTREKNKLKLLPKELEVNQGCCNNEVDRISQLPDEILVSIISRLTLQEATATSILSTRWRHLYTYIISLKIPFIFNQRKSYVREYIQEIQEKKLPDYLSRINHTLDSYKGGRHLKEFRVHMPRLWGANIEKWFEFALSREIEIVDIRMIHCINSMNAYYIFPLSTLISKNDRQSLVGLKCLKELSLSGVHMDDRDVELLISHFIVLERLSIESSGGLKKVNVVGHSVHKLKHLNISNCYITESIEVRDMINLVSLRCYRLLSTYVLLLNNVPKLVQFNACETLFKILPRISSCVHDQLLHLKLSVIPDYIMSHEFMLPKLINLKHMELEVTMGSTCGTNELFPLIEACPSLEKLETKFLWSLNAKYIHRRIYECRIRTKAPNYNLKKVRLSGYFGSVSELEFALYVMNNAVALQELIVEACNTTREIWRRAIARACQHFQSKTPNSVKLVIM